MIKFSQRNWETKAVETVVLGVGTTLFEQGESVRVMSDIWEWQNIVYFWDGERVTSRASTWEYQTADEKVQVTFDADLATVLPKVREYYYQRALQRETSKAQDRAARMEKGTIVKVVRGKTGVGTVGKITAISTKTYGYRNTVTKFAVAIDDEMTTFTGSNGRQYPCHKNVVWVYSYNCEVANPVIDMAAVERIANEEADREVASIERKARACGCV